MGTAEFDIDDDKLKEISAAFKIDETSVQLMYKEYMDFSAKIHGQYLAHVMRGIECYFRKKLNNNHFIVVCEPYTKYSAGQKNSSADYYQGSKFVINYKGDMDEKDIHAYIAHEIGHLFLLARKDISEKDKREKLYAGTTEPLSSIFGIFTVSEKTAFYANYDFKTRNYENWQKILDVFLEMT
jgi:hypothetical protein